MASGLGDQPKAERHCRQLGRQVARLNNAWAAWRDAAENAHLAAVMGDSFARHARPDAGSWWIAAQLDNDSELQDQLRASAIDSDHAAALQATMRNHIAWLLGNIEALRGRQ